MKKFAKPWFRPSRNTWYVTLDGKQINLGRNQKQAFEQYKQLLARPRPKVLVASDSLVAIIDAFLDWCQKHRAADTYEWYRYRLQLFAQRQPDLTTRDLQPYHVQQWLDSFGSSNGSKRNFCRSVKRCMRWAKKQGYVDRNPIADLELPKGGKREEVASCDDFDHLLATTSNADFRELVIVTWETGCRPQESLRVEARHFDLEHSRWIFPEGEGKTGVRVVYLTEKAMEITMRLVLKYPEGKLFRNSNGRAWTTEAVNCAFHSIQIRMGKAIMKERGLHVTDEEVDAFVKTLKPEKTVRRVMRKKTDSELRQEARRKLTNKLARSFAPKWCLYTLRHSWATHALQRGLDALTVAILMGHKDPSTLARVYQHLSHNPQHLHEQARKAAG